MMMMMPPPCHRVLRDGNIVTYYIVVTGGKFLFFFPYRKLAGLEKIRVRNRLNAPGGVPATEKSLFPRTFFFPSSSV